MSACPGSEQLNMCVVANATSGMREASSATRLTSTTSEMLPPQWQMNTPMRVGWTSGIVPSGAGPVASNMVGSPRGRGSAADTPLPQRTRRLVVREDRSATAMAGVMRKNRNEATRQPEPLAATLRLGPRTRVVWAYPDPLSTGILESGITQQAFESITYGDVVKHGRGPHWNSELRIENGELKTGDRRPRASGVLDPHSQFQIPDSQF